MSIDIEIHTPEAVDKVLNHARNLIQKAIQGGSVLLTLGRLSKSREQEQKYHAMINDIAKTVWCAVYDEFGHIVPGMRRQFDSDYWKAVLVDGFEQELREQGIKLKKPSRIVRSLDRQRWVSLRASTRDFGKQHASMFIEYLYAQGTELGATFSEKALAYYDDVNNARS